MTAERAMRESFPFMLMSRRMPQLGKEALHRAEPLAQLWKSRRPTGEKACNEQPGYTPDTPIEETPVK